MISYVALLRAVNVGGTGKLPMSELRAMCESAGFSSVETYIASGNVVFRTKLPAAKVKALLEEALLEYAGKPVGVLLRTAAELKGVMEENPFPDAPGNRVVAVFLNDPPPASLLDELKGLKNEVVIPGKREIYVRYDDGMGTSKLVIPAAKMGTARNMNTVAKLVEMLEALRPG